VGLQTPAQKLWALGIVLAFLAVLALAVSAVLTSLSDDNMKDLGNWLDDNIESIGAGLLAVIPSVATYLFGRGAGRKVGKTEAYNSAIATVSDSTDPTVAAHQLRQEARAHNLEVMT
jgi:hypothetical protein